MADPMKMMMALGGDSDPEEASESPDEKMAEKDGLTITPPKGFKAPDDAQDGDDFEVVAKCKMMGDKLVLQSLNGVKLDGEGSESDEDEAAPDTGGEEPLDGDPGTSTNAGKEQGY